MPIKDMIFTEETIQNMDFSTLVSIVREPNMCSGGVNTIREVVRESDLKYNAKILEIGSNTGFSSIEFATRLPYAQVTGIDINSQSVIFATDKAKTYGIGNVSFLQSNALQLPFENESFDLVFCSNVTSFINDKESAISEYLRVLKPNGILAAVPIYYTNEPPGPLLKEVEQAIQANLNVWPKEFWIQKFSTNDLHLIYSNDFKYIKSSNEEVEKYVDMVMAQEHLSDFPDGTKALLKKRLEYFYDLFEDNLQYCGFSILLYRFKSANNIPMLHKTCSVKY